MGITESKVRNVSQNRLIASRTFPDTNYTGRGDRSNTPCHIVHTGTMLQVLNFCIRLGAVVLYSYGRSRQAAIYSEVLACSAQA